MRLKKYRARLKYAILLLMALFLLSNRGFRTLVRNSLEYRRLKNQKVKLEAEKIRLGTRLRIMKEPGQVEHMARKELGLTRPDEIEYRFPPPK